MIVLILERQATIQSENPTLGTLTAIDNITGKIVLEIKSLELPWKDNKKFISCVTPGTYPIFKWNISGKFKYPHFLIKNVKGRSQIKIHIANFVAQLEGCIAPGLSFKDIDSDGVIDITNSEIALKKLLEVMPDESTITII